MFKLNFLQTIECTTLRRPTPGPLWMKIVSKSSCAQPLVYVLTMLAEALSPFWTRGYQLFLLKLPDIMHI